ncbi:U2 small nuclear ribonucleoprotein auxiliary factor 35 kDa subunit-related protein 1-like [Triplophysa dalaica]|uniref:U2 small nuclear ribonucleoprotein auxiliary factor 35 kDa subunit-related protein 1-like n=1 Tax=Triplophysa dalaica TaxID=1582913 RepID=UPI0024DF4352|nr:U2 small nuclear ribonucleoprotein auxiliary factor 35 kDa subunit-related protein 1-like [Triplophysa dalaica]
MTHEKRFSKIPMSKRMRDLCKEEDYAFLNSQRDPDQSSEERHFSESQKTVEERDRRQQERELQRQEKQCEIEEQQKEKEEKWKSHVAEIAVKQEAIHARRHRLREFRDFQKKVLLQDLGPDAGSVDKTINHLLMRL